MTAADVWRPPGAETTDEPVLHDARRGTPWTLTTYFAEGLPFSIVHQVSAELFTSFNTSLAAIAYTSLFGLAWNVKFVWSPLVERYGTLRRWIVLLELLIGAVMIAVASRAGQGDIRAVTIALVAVAFLGATQDVAVDGYYLSALEKPAQASLSGMRVGAYRVALLVGKSGLVALAGFTSWRASFLAAGAVMIALAGMHRALLRPIRGGAGHRDAPTRIATEPAESPAWGGDPDGSAGGRAAVPPRDGKERRSASPISAFGESFASFLKKPRVAVIIAFVVLFKAGDALLFNMSVPFMKSLGLDTYMRGLLSAPSLIASVAGTTIGGIWIRRSSLARALMPIGALQALAIPLYTLLAILRPSFAVIAFAVSVEQLIAGLGNAALLVFLMRVAEGPHKTAHFAIGSAFMTIPMTLVGLVSGDLAQGLGFARFFLVAFLIAIPGALLCRVAPKG
ncbi:MAG: MFS transporter [Polyangiaceae bacterium]